VYSSVRNPDHTAVVNAISVVISVVQVAMITLAVRLLRRGGGGGTAIGIPEGST
jgi:ABC-type spermidine/putrescine transport system permease subunit II